MRFKRRYRWPCLAALLFLLGFGTGAGRAGLVDLPERLLAFAEKRWGREAPPRLRIWQRLLRDNTGARVAGRPDATSLQQVNRFFNQVPFVADIDNWGVEDYWATPVEMLSSFGGDCEDYSIGKYLSLREIGVPVAKLRITYVRALRLNVSHMVLAYYPTPDAEPLILDNLTGDIRLASQRTDLQPVYGFNDDDLWFAGDSNKGSSSNVRLWRELLEKLAKEQKI